MMKRKDESAMFGHLRGVTKQLCRINPKSYEAIVKQVKTLKSFNCVLQDAADMNGGESGYEDDFGMLINCVLKRTEEMAEKIEEFDHCPRTKEVELIGHEIGELCGISGEIIGVHVRLLHSQDRIMKGMPRGNALVAAMKHTKALENLLHDAGLMVDGIISRFESIRNGVFTK